MNTGLMDYVAASPGATYQELSVTFNVSVPTVRRWISKLRRQRLIRTEEVGGRAEVHPWTPAVWTPEGDDDVIHAADLFCGAGGTSHGLALELEAMGYDLNKDVDLVAINHDQDAIATHAANHPWARHCTEDIEDAMPRRLFPGGHLHLLVASPSCVHFSTARGGRPVNDQLRTHAWQVVRWARDLDVDCILVENVKEFRSWGPVINGKPVKDGSCFRRWKRELERLGYTVDDRVLNAADYGDATSRHRIFILAVKGDRGVPWPEPTHSKDGEVPGTEPWRGAKEVIDWSLEGKSIFTRKKPLAEKTLKRIAEGIRRSSDLDLEPFLLKFYGTSTSSSLDEPMPTVTASGKKLALVEPVLVDSFGSKDNYRARVKGVDEPMGTIAGKGRWGVAAPFVLGQHSGNAPRSTDDPLPTILGGGAHSLVRAFVLPPDGFYGAPNRPRSTDEPLPTITASRGGQIGVVEPFGLQLTHGGRVKNLKEPLPTLTTAKRGEIGLIEGDLHVVQGGHVGEPFTVTTDRPETNRSLPRPVSQPIPTVVANNVRIGLVEGVVKPYLVPNYGEAPGQKPRTHDVDEPLPTVTGHGAGAVVEPVLVSYYGNGQPHSVDAPLPTQTGKDRFGLVMPSVVMDGARFLLDIRFRMLQPHELAAAMGFEGYEFKGTKTQIVKQIGNAVAVNMARALVKGMLGKAPVGLDAWLQGPNQEGVPA